MKLVKLAAAIAALSLGAMATNASAVVYNLNVDGSSGGVLPGSSGTVTVNNIAGTGGLDFTVQLAPNHTFWSSGGHTSFAFTLTGEPAGGVTFSSLTAGFVGAGAAGSFGPGSFPDPSIGSFEYGIDCPSCTGADPHPSLLHFIVTPTTGTTQLVLAANANNVYGAADVRRNGALTGAVGFTTDVVINPNAGVPEPATWAMMILGMGMVGAGLRIRRRKPVVAA